MVAMHRDRGAAATIALTHVEDARPYGLVPTEPDGRVLEFREKPTEPVPGDINAGTYVLEPAALAAWERGRNLSIERDVFPALIEQGRPLYGFVSDAYWIDLGTPEKHLRAHFDILDGKVAFEPAFAAPFVADDADVDLRAHLGRWVVVGRGARIGAGAQLDDCVIHADAVVEDDARIVGSILGPGSRVGAGATVRDSVLGEGAVVEPGTSRSGESVSAGERAGSPEVPGTAQPLG
jgi:mannose-1-phosphate guanylyltransferase